MGKNNQETIIERFKIDEEELKLIEKIKKAWKTEHNLKAMEQGEIIFIKEDESIKGVIENYGIKYGLFLFNYSKLFFDFPLDIKIVPNFENIKKYNCDHIVDGAIKEILECRLNGCNAFNELLYRYMRDIFEKVNYAIRKGEISLKKHPLRKIFKYGILGFARGIIHFSKTEYQMNYFKSNMRMFIRKHICQLKEDENILFSGLTEEDYNDGFFIDKKGHINCLSYDESGNEYIYKDGEICLYDDVDKVRYDFDLEDKRWKRREELYRLETADDMNKRGEQVLKLIEQDKKTKFINKELYFNAILIFKEAYRKGSPNACVHLADIYKKCRDLEISEIETYDFWHRTFELELNSYGEYPMEMGMYAFKENRFVFKIPDYKKIKEMYKKIYISDNNLDAISKYEMMNR